ncbi:unnamed protein product [Durusdinium trenchii]|uniref:Uncharacterized protein n=3 Tax=Durusdinium trenchii TaxID=1381693 RepID=A0ABP0J6I5_9DINO
MISHDMPTVPLPKQADQGEGLDLVPLGGELFLPPRADVASKEGVEAMPADFVELAAAGDFSACGSALLQELKSTHESDLLPLLVGVLGHIGAIEFADRGRQRQRRRGAFSKSVDDGENVKVVDDPFEAFRQLRRAAFSSDAKVLLRHELGDRLEVNSTDQVGSEMLRFGFAEGRIFDDMRQAFSEEHAQDHIFCDEPCGF